MLQNYVYKLSVSFNNYTLLITNFIITVIECHVKSVYSQLTRHGLVHILQSVLNRY
jgi:hypothetical protein